MRIGSLFSGVGGLETGIEAARLGTTVWQVEQSKFALGVLKKHWPSALRFHDVRRVSKDNLRPIDLLCGGFPCTDLSTAGRQEGLEGERSGLWYEFLRLIHELTPAAILIENVTSGACNWVPTIKNHLDEAGYNALALNLYASDVGAPQRRARTFVLATEKNLRRVRNPVVSERATTWMKGLPESPLDERNPLATYFPPRFPKGLGTEQYAWEPPRLVPEKGHYDRNRLHALGNAVVPACGYVCAVILGHLMNGLSYDEARALGPNWLPVPLRASWGLSIHRSGENWPTTTASMACRGGSSDAEDGDLLKEVIGLKKYRVPGQYGYMNPEWVERLMGFPVGWTLPAKGTPAPDVCWNDEAGKNKAGKSIFYGKEYMP